MDATCSIVRILGVLVYTALPICTWSDSLYRRLESQVQIYSIKPLYCFSQKARKYVPPID